jgi:hypothetical protein
MVAKVQVLPAALDAPAPLLADNGYFSRTTAIARQGA